jgi:parallel beta-helix repeat protein
MNSLIKKIKNMVNSLINPVTKSSVIDYTGVNNKTISGLTIEGKDKVCIKLSNCSGIYITKCKLINSSLDGIYLYNCTNVTIEGNYFENVSTAINVVDCPLGSILVNSNQAKNMKGPFPKGQFVQFNNVSGPNNAISNNIVENIYGQSYPEDVISLYKCNGTEASSILVENNKIRGGGPSKSGGGIMLGDNGGSHIIARNNILVNPGQYGMAISGGTFMSLINNTIYSAQEPYTNVGLYIMNIGDYPQANNTVLDNKVQFFNATGESNASWLEPSTAKPAGWESNTFGDSSLNASILPVSLITFK